MVTIYDNTIEIELRQLIGRSAAGTRLPSVRDLVRRHRVSPVTAQRVITLLEREGLVDARPGSGTFVRGQALATVADFDWQTVALGRRPPFGHGLGYINTTAAPGMISFASGYLDETLQAQALLASAGARAARRPEAWNRVPTQGLAELRTWFAADLGGGARADDVLVVSGGQAALSLAFRTLASPGDAVVVESPTYIGALEAAALNGLTPIPVPIDDLGVRPDLFADALDASGARIAFVQPTVANPTGATMPTERRAALLQIAKERGVFIVEDDFMRDLVFDGAPPRPIAADDVDGHVVYIRSLTKSAAPGLRIAGMIVRGPAMRRMSNTRLVEDFFVPGVLQHTALEAVTSPRWPRHLINARRALEERMAAAQVAIRRTKGRLTLDNAPSGGVALWLRLPSGADDVIVTERARDAGVLVSAGSAFFAGEPAGAFIRLSVAAVPLNQVATGIARLATALG